MIDHERLKNLLIELIKIDSLSRKEFDVAMRLKREMEELGATVAIDDAGERVGGNVGNLIAHFPGNVAGAEPLLLSAHMDTVVPGEGIVPILDGDILRTDGRTVLGGDDKSGVAIICEVLRVIKENRIPCSAVDVVFTICEEAGLIGAKCLDVSRLRARVDAMEEQLDRMKAKGALETELQDTRARIDKLQEDLDNLRNVSPDDWWDVSSERVTQYIDRVQESIKRLDDNKAQENQPRG